MAYMFRHPELVTGKVVLEPYSGAGPIGLVALKLGAERVTFVDFNRRAMEFLMKNVARNTFPLNRISTTVADFTSFSAPNKFAAKAHIFVLGIGETNHRPECSRSDSRGS